MSQGETIPKFTVPSWIKSGLLGGALVSAVGVVLFVIFVRVPLPPTPPNIEPTKDRPIILPALVNVTPGDWTDLKPKVLANHAVTWIHAPLHGLKTKTTADGLTLLGCHDGEFWIAAVTAVDGAVSKPEWVRVVVGKPKPPVPPIPPDPVPPDPVPPTPPIPEAGFRVLIVYETAAVTPEVASVLSSELIRSYTREKCAKDGTTPAFRAFDKDAAADKDYPWVSKAMARSRTALPWLIVSNGKSGFEGPLPATVNETMAILKKFGD